MREGIMQNSGKIMLTKMTDSAGNEFEMEVLPVKLQFTTRDIAVATATIAVMVFAGHAVGHIGYGVLKRLRKGEEKKANWTEAVHEEEPAGKEEAVTPSPRRRQGSQQEKKGS